MKKQITVAAIIVALMGFLYFYGCGNKPTQDTGNTETENTAAVMGKLVDTTGNPVANATVHIRKKTTLADTSGSGLGKILADTATVTTDDTGGFIMEKIDLGLYVIEGAKDSDMVLIDSVEIKEKNTKKQLHPDTLKHAGALKGIVYLSEGGDPRKVFVLAFGIDRFASVDTNGMFKFSNLAKGRYNLRLISSLNDYGVLDTSGVQVMSANTTDMDTIRLPFTGIPVPKNVVITYDTLKQIVTLTWAKADSSHVKGYNVYRRNVDSSAILARINVSTITDTLYRDSTGIQNITYEYRVVAVSPSDMEGTKSAAVTIKTVPFFALVDSIGLGLFQGYQVLKIAPSGKIFVADILSSSWKIYVFDSSLTLVRTIDTLSVRYPANFDVDSAGNIYLINQDGIFKFDTIGALLDTITTWHNAENKTLRLYKGSLYVASGQIRRYALDGVLLDSTGMIGADGLVVLRDTIFIGGSGSELRMLDTNLTTIGNWQMAFEENEIAWGLAKDEQNNLFILGYHSNPNIFTALFYDSNRNYIGKMSIESLSKHIDVRNGKLFLSSLTSTGQIKVYQLW